MQDDNGRRFYFAHGSMTVQKTATAASGTGAARSVFRMRWLQRQTDSWM
ncbi:MAG: hypothetical protein ACLR8P_05025 [Clostridium fessum]